VRSWIVVARALAGATRLFRSATLVPANAQNAVYAETGLLGGAIASARGKRPGTEERR